MALKLDPKVVSVIVSAVQNSPGGATLNDIIAAFTPPPDRRIAHRWLAALIRVGVLDVDTSAKANRYIVKTGTYAHVDTSAAAPETPPNAPADHVSTSHAPAVEPADVDTSAGPASGDVSRSLAAPARRADKAGKPSVHMAATDVSTSPDSASPAHPETSRRRVHIAAATVSTSRREPVAPAHLDTLSATPDAPHPRPTHVSRSAALATKPADVDTSARLPSGHVSPSAAVPARAAEAAAKPSVHRVTDDVSTSVRNMPAAADVDTSPTGAGQPAAGRSGSRRLAYLIGVLGVALVAAVVASTWYWRVQHRPPAEAVGAYLVNQLKPLPVEVGAIDVTYDRVTANQADIRYGVWFVTTRPLFRRVEITDYLRTHAAADLTALDAASALLHGPDAGRLRAAVGSLPSAPDADPAALLADVVLVTTQTPPETATFTQGKLVAWRESGAWRFSGDPVAVDRSTLAGEPRPVGAFAVDAPKEAAQLQTLIANRAAYAAKVIAAAKALSNQSDSVGSSAARAEDPAAGTIRAAPQPTASSPAPSAVPALTSDRPPSPVPTANTEPRTENSAPAAWPPIVAAGPAAYVLSGQWLPLPQNNARVIETGRSAPADSATPEVDSSPAAELTMDGRAYVPVVSGESLVIAYVGSVRATATQSGDPVPPIELAPETLLGTGARSAPLYRVAPGVLTLGRNRVTATTEQVTLPMIGTTSRTPAILLRCSSPLPPGRYVLYCGANAYELMVE